MMQDQYGGCGKATTCCLADIPLGQAPINVQGHCHVATVISWCAKAQEAYNRTFGSISRLPPSDGILSLMWRRGLSVLMNPGAMSAVA